jgi:hypothetical protein
VEPFQQLSKVEKKNVNEDIRIFKKEEILFEGPTSHLIFPILVYGCGAFWK